jgi:hypothetical protein
MSSPVDEANVDSTSHDGGEATDAHIVAVPSAGDVDEQPLKRRGVESTGMPVFCVGATTVIQCDGMIEIIWLFGCLLSRKPKVLFFPQSTLSFLQQFLRVILSLLLDEMVNQNCKNLSVCSRDLLYSVGRFLFSATRRRQTEKL